MPAGSGVRRAMAIGLGVGTLVRLPFWIEAWRTPLSTDLSIIGLMAMHPGLDLTMWSQPYGSPLEAWLAVPLFAVLGPTANALRILYALLSLALVPLGVALANAMDERAALPLAIVLACPPPYLLVLGAHPPPLYPSVLLLCLALLLLTPRVPTPPSQSSYARLGLWGILAGLALWTHPVSLSAVLPSGAVLLWRHRARPRAVLLASGAFLIGIAPLIATATSHEAGLLSVLSVHGHAHSAARHLAALGPRLHKPLGGLLGTHSPIVADARLGAVHVPLAIAAILVVVYAWSVPLAWIRRRAIPHAGVLFAAVALALLCFLLPLRSAPNTIRYLTPLYVPLVLLVVLAHLVGTRPRRAVHIALLLASVHVVGSGAVLHAWRGWDRAAPPFALPDLAPVERELDSLGVRRAFSSRGVAFRLTFATRERVVVSQPWNQRFRGHPVPYLDEVRFARQVAWILPHHDPRPYPLPQPRAMSARLRAAGIHWSATDVGHACVFHSFRAALGDHVRALAPPDDLRVEGSTLHVGADAEGTPLDAITVLAPHDGRDLPDGLLLRVTSADAEGHVREITQRASNDEIQWVNGHPEYAVYRDVRVFQLDGSTFLRAAIEAADGTAWEPGTVLAHPRDSRSQHAPEWIDVHGRWDQRERLLAQRPLPHLAGWHFRTMLIARRN